ncbi:hypothetical protein RIF29_07367 [Crotalaria pallida]|uniref:Uncharacterized protein n=1 Tax=Crotalaria pallida TaxID=3830 RepID=A0AAN9J425_CROPI
MGACLSCSTSSKFNNIRVVHINGYVEDFEQPISVGQVIGYPAKHFVCTSIQLLSSSSKPLVRDTLLQPGQLYFMLPYSILESDVSPVDLALLAKRLTTIAKTRDKSFKASSSPCRVGVNKMMMMNGERSPCRVQPWKPILESIKERSFNMRSESDLQDLELRVTTEERKKASY